MVPDLTRVEDERVICAVLDHLGTPSKSCPKSFVRIQLDLAEILSFVTWIIFNFKNPKNGFYIGF